MCYRNINAQGVPSDDHYGDITLLTAGTFVLKYVSLKKLLGKGYKHEVKWEKIIKHEYMKLRWFVKDRTIFCYYFVSHVEFLVPRKAADTMIFSVLNQIRRTYDPR